MIEIKSGKSIKDYGLKIGLNTGNTLYVLRLRDNDTNEKHLVVTASDIKGRFYKPLKFKGNIKKSKELYPFNLGISDERPKKDEPSDLELLIDYINNTNLVPEAYFYERFGFSENSYGNICFNGSEIVQMEEEEVVLQEDYIIDNCEYPCFITEIGNETGAITNKEILFVIKENLQKRGNVEEAKRFYIETLKETKTPVMSIAVAAGFASPLLHLLKREPILLNLSGTSSTGKTSASLLVSSLYSKADDDRLLLDFDSTLMAIEGRLEGFKGVPVILDDKSTNQSKEKIGSKFVYTLAKGVGRSRLDKDKKPTVPGHWNNLILMSSEDSILADCDEKYLGALRRIIEIIVERGEITTTEDMAKDIKEFTKETFGLLGVEFLKVIVRDDVDYKGLYKQEVDLSTSIVKDKTDIEQDGITKGFIELLAPILVAAKIANKYMGFEFDISSMRDRLIQALKDGRGNLGKNK